MSYNKSKPFIWKDGDSPLPQKRNFKTKNWSSAVYSTASLATFMWPLRSMGIRSLFSLTKSQVDCGLDLKPSERYTQGQSFSSNIDEMSTGKPTTLLISQTKCCLATSSPNVLSNAVILSLFY